MPVICSCEGAAHMQQPAGKQEGFDLMALVVAKGKALHGVRQDGSYSTHRGRHQSPLQGSQLKCGTIYNCCCTTAADSPLHSKIDLHKFTQNLSSANEAVMLQHRHSNQVF